MDLDVLMPNSTYAVPNLSSDIAEYHRRYELNKPKPLRKQMLSGLDERLSRMVGANFPFPAQSLPVLLNIQSLLLRRS